jgi:nitroreductase
MDLMEAIRERRSIRKYKADPVSEEALQKVIEAVRWSPSWANTQCWEVIIVRDPNMKSELANTLTATNPARS